MEMDKCIVVYFSRSGNTKKVGELIASKLSCDLKAITPIKSYKGLFGWLKAGYQAASKKIPPLNSIDINFNEFDLVIVGTPVWAGNMSSPIRSFLTNNSKNFKNVAFFNTSGGADNINVCINMGELIELEPKAMLDLSQKEVKEDSIKEKVEEFIQKLQ